MNESVQFDANPPGWRGHVCTLQQQQGAGRLGWHEGEGEKSCRCFMTNTNCEWTHPTLKQMHTNLEDIKHTRWLQGGWESSPLWFHKARAEERKLEGTLWHSEKSVPLTPWWNKKQILAFSFNFLVTKNNETIFMSEILVNYMRKFQQIVQ